MRAIIFSLIISFTILYSCKDGANEDVKSSKEIFVYEDTDTPREVNFHKKNYDSVFYYYKNGNLFAHGLLDSLGRRVEKWHFYNDDGKLSEVREYKRINGEYLLNQKFYLTKDGDTAVWGSKKFNYYKQKEYERENDEDLASDNFFINKVSGDTISVKDSYIAIITHYTPIARICNPCPQRKDTTKSKQNYNPKKL